MDSFVISASPATLFFRDLLLERMSLVGGQVPTIGVTIVSDNARSHVSARLTHNTQKNVTQKTKHSRKINNKRRGSVARQQQQQRTLGGNVTNVNTPVDSSRWQSNLLAERTKGLSRFAQSSSQQQQSQTQSPQQPQRRRSAEKETKLAQTAQKSQSKNHHSMPQRPQRRPSAHKKQPPKPPIRKASIVSISSLGSGSDHSYLSWTSSDSDHSSGSFTVAAIAA